MAHITEVGNSSNTISVPALIVKSPTVIDAYFAKLIEEEIPDPNNTTPQPKTHSFKGGETYNGAKLSTLSAMAKKFGVSVADIQNENGMGKSTNVRADKTYKVTEPKGKQPTVKKAAFEKLTKANAGEEVYIVVETENLVDKKLRINIRQGKEKCLAKKDEPVNINGSPNLPTTVGEFAKNSKYHNKEDFKNWGIKKVSLKPADADKEKWKTALKAATDKKAHLYVLVDVHSDNNWKANQITYKGNSSTDDTDISNAWLDEEGKYLEFGQCGCIDYEIDNGLLKGSNVIHTLTGSKVKSSGSLNSVKAIVLHRTVGSKTKGAVSHSKGTHFYVDGKKGTDGQIFQAMNLSKKSNHILTKKSRIARLDITSANSVGIEVVGLAYNKNKKGELSDVYGNSYDNKIKITKGYKDSGGTHYWDKLTDKQIKSVVCIVKSLMCKYKLKKADILTHEKIQQKTAGEGQAVYDAIINKL